MPGFLRTLFVTCSLCWLATAGMATSSVPQDSAAGFRNALRSAENMVSVKRWDDAEAAAVRALERDGKNPAAWDVRARAAAGAGDVDLEIYCRHKELRFLVAQGAARATVKEKREALIALDPVAAELFELKDSFARKFTSVAEAYEKADRPHGAIGIWKEVQALDPDAPEAAAAIERIASAPDPSLAANAKPKDLFEDVTDEWIAEHDAEHVDWKKAAKLTRPNYHTVSNAGYEVLVRTGEAMEQMSAFYKRFFRYGGPDDSRSVPRITVHVFKSRDEYLKLGIGPPVEWSAGHFTGSHVECYVDKGGFAGMVGTLFHEAAHQYVSLATNAQGWLNEGLASFFEGTRILPNGSIIMNEPADHRLGALAGRMEKGWMEHPQDTEDPNDPNSIPKGAPTWSMILENAYDWGPAWYAPTWGLVFFCYNFQHPTDGRFVYRDAFLDFINKSGGKTGKTAIKTFEETVLANPKAPYKGLDGEPLSVSSAFQLPKNVAELDPVWKKYILELWDERSGKAETARPLAEWARLAAANGDFEIAKEHFEKAVANRPEDAQLAIDFARLLHEEFSATDRAAKVVDDALTMLDAQEVPDETLIGAAERLLAELDPKRRTLTRAREELAEASRAIIASYREAGRPAMIQDLSWRFAAEFGLNDLFEDYADAVVARGEDLTLWDLAYNEQNLDGWTASSPIFQPASTVLEVKNGPFDPNDFDFKYLTYDRVTGGDISMVADVQAEPGKSAYLGFLFGVKGNDAFHAALYYPARKGAEGTASSGYLDVMSSFGGGVNKPWRHVPIAVREVQPGESSTGEWHEMRLDVTGRVVDVWWDGMMVASHEFPSRDILLGSFGIIAGTGQAKYRNVRFKSRDAMSPAGRIERRMRLEQAGLDAGSPVDGSFQGVVPPFPKIKRWAQGTRNTFTEIGERPQLLVLWSIAQNNLVPIDGWLNSFAKNWESVGLEVISVVAAEDDEAVDAYLAEHPFPGAVGVDHRPPNVYGVGETFDAYSILRFNLPRVILIGVDGRVVWEGDPGFSSNALPAPPYESYVDVPMEDLVGRGKLLEVAEWRKSWESSGARALRLGDLEAALPLLRAAAEFGEVPFTEVRRAAAKLTALEAAMDDPSGILAAVEAVEAGPCLRVLRDWSKVADLPLPKSMTKEISAAVKLGDKDWKAAVKEASRAAKSKKSEAEAIAELVTELEGLEGGLVRALLQDVRDLGLEAARSAESLPAGYLATSIFGW
ncbi:Tetratricopeptide repeat protein [Planctomycetes bacterium Poly30]|uniref:Tetratricopeptide repeat protein n=1 Tax=Saltatorellus ferox TaxID=2528018 RepID=A0A518EU37_9BACT|nr:Tetratricopeptide repeat protein [Planctomycetes bacterium Poly30]